MESRGLIRIGGNLEKGLTLEAVLSGFLFEEGNKWVAYCQVLDLSSCGETSDEALKNIREAIRLFFDSCIARNTLHQVLIELGWICQTPDGAYKELTDQCFPSRILPAFVIEKLQKKGETWSGRVIMKDVKNPSS